VQGRAARPPNAGLAPAAADPTPTAPRAPPPTSPSQDFLPPFSYRGVVATYNAQGARVFVVPAAYDAALGFKAAAAKGAAAPAAGGGKAGGAGGGKAGSAPLPEDDDYFDTLVQDAEEDEEQQQGGGAEEPEGAEEPAGPLDPLEQAAATDTEAEEARR
jgi:hypothetical protein